MTNNPSTITNDYLNPSGNASAASIVDTYLAASMPRTSPAITSFYSADAPDPANTMSNPAANTSAENPPGLTWLTTADTSFRVLWEQHTPPSTVISPERSTITCVIVLPTIDDGVAVLKTALTGGSIALMLGANAGGRTITANRVALDAFKVLDLESGFPLTAGPTCLAALRISAASADFRST